MCVHCVPYTIYSVLSLILRDFFWDTSSKKMCPECVPRVPNGVPQLNPIFFPFCITFFATAK